MKRYIIIFCFIANLKVGLQLGILNTIIDDIIRDVIPLETLVAIAEKYVHEETLEH